MSDSNSEGKDTKVEGLTGLLDKQDSNVTSTVDTDTSKEGDKSTEKALSPLDYLKLDVSKHPSFTKMQGSLGRQIQEKDTTLTELTTKNTDLQSQLAALQAEVNEKYPTDDAKKSADTLRQKATELIKANETIKTLKAEITKLREGELSRDNESKKSALIAQLKADNPDAVNSDVEKILMECESKEEVNRMAEFLKIKLKGSGLPRPPASPNESALSNAEFWKSYGKEGFVPSAADKKRAREIYDQIKR